MAFVARSAQRWAPKPTTSLRAALGAPQVRSFASKKALPKTKENIVLVEGVRTPFCMASTDLKPMMANDLAREAIKGLLVRTALDPSLVQYVCMGTVIQEVRTSNVAREAALQAGVPNSVPAHTVTQACISANQAMTSAMGMIYAGNAEIAISGGTETMSDAPIRFSKALRARMIASTKLKDLGSQLALLKGLKLKDLAPEAPAVAEFSTGEVMGHSADRLCSYFGVSREAQDAFALRSHTNADKAAKAGLLTDIVRTKVPGKDKFVDRDNGVRVSTPAKLASLKPAFIKPHGTVTAANSSYLTDGGSAALIMTEKKALELGYKPKAYLRQFTYASQDPENELLLGPAYASTKLLSSVGLTLEDIDVFEVHEAFAGQVLSVMSALDSDWFCQNKLNTKKLGAIPMDKLNNWGGSLAIGHPFGATGTRLVTMAANRLHHEDGKYALVTACAAGGLGHAMIVERYPA